MCSPFCLNRKDRQGLLWIAVRVNISPIRNIGILVYWTKHWCSRDKRLFWPHYFWGRLARESLFPYRPLTSENLGDNRHNYFRGKLS